MSAKKDAKKLRDEAFIDDGVDGKILGEIICKRKNEELMSLQKEFAKLNIREVRNSGESNGQPLDLVKFIDIKLKNRNTAVERRGMMNLLERILKDPYLRTSPSERETSNFENYGEVRAPNFNEMNSDQFVELFFSKDKNGGLVMNFCQVKKIVGGAGTTVVNTAKITGEMAKICKAYIDFATS